jgi:hypothetical protein
MRKTESPQIKTAVRPEVHDPAPWLERTEQLIEAFRGRLHATAPKADPGVAYLWLAADHLFERHGGHADFALLEVDRLLEPTQGQQMAANKRVQLLLALTTFYAFLGESRSIPAECAAAIRADVAEALGAMPFTDS